MGVILTAVSVTAAVTIIGGGLGYFLYLRTRPKKETWSARIYQLGEGVREPRINKEGKIISNLRLNDLRKWFEEHNDRSEDYLQLLEIKKRLDELLLHLESRCQGECCKRDEKRG